MTKDKYVISKTKRYPYYILMFAILIWFVAMEIFGTNERMIDMSADSLIYSGRFTWQKPDGSAESVDVPGHYSIPAGETMILTTTLPDDYNAHVIAFRSSLQDVKCYIDGELRTEYSTKDTRLSGKNSASRYIFCDTSSADAGKELRIELTTYTHKYSGVINPVYCGDRAKIWVSLFDQNGSETIIAFFILFSGIISVLFSIALGLVYKTKFDIEYLGWCMIMGATWMLGESKLKQLLFPNSSILSALCFVMIMLVPIPILFYADSVQQGRYHKLHQTLGYIAVINFTVCTILHVTGIADYIETLPISQIILGVTFVSTLITFYKCMKQGTIRFDRLTLIGLSAVMISAIVEGLSVYFVVSISGMFMGIGMIILLFMSILRTIRNVHNMEVQRQQRALEKRRQQTERLSLQMMQTLALTVEAKDEYTRGHSHRVAEYAALIAKELHWSPEEILNLQYAAHLHDIGKVGIPDTILNKPTRLTPEEYAVTKEHTVIGGEILKNITLLKRSADVARHHHERYDGKGYPDGLKGTDISLYARIIAIADGYDVMNTNHSCRNSLPEASIIREFRENSGTQFDPELTEIFLMLLEEHRLDINSDYLHPENDLGFTAIENDINRFISNVMTTMKTHEDSETYDFLTGLPMRSRGEKLVSQFMQKYDGCLVFIDMDNLKQINDTHGHKAGDRSLKLLGKLLSDMTPDAVVCRLGGDEFLFFMPNATEATITAQVHTLFDKFNAAKAKDIEIRSASLSAGLCMTTTKDAYEDCYTKADKALYYVKQNGKGNLYFYHQLEQKLISDSAFNKDLTLIARSLRSSGDYSGALDLDYRQFAKSYEYINRLGSRHQYPCYLVMVTMETAPEQMTYIENIEEALECMKHSIHQSIRSIDICTRYSSMQYLIILFKPDENYIPKIMNRIFAEYYKLYKKHNFIPGYEYLRMMDKPAAEETRQR